MIPIALLALEVPCAVPMCPGPTGHDDVLLQSVVRLLADGTAWYCTVEYNSAVAARFLLSRKQIFMFFGAMGTWEDGKWGVHSI